ncbi:Histone-lysine N-methyltransferase, H3 lysine-9 specific SUVH6 [Spatholobus suberectus]|nr:Histone-lysine N-methyltransferase, H3 lysine-9 specific SUVH6 [Spatholobus suberectus]
MKIPPENKREKYVTLPEKSNHHQVKINSKAVVKEENRDGVSGDKTSGQEIIVYPEVRSPETKPLDISRSKHKLKGNFNRLRVSSDMKVVLGLMAKSECPWRSDKGSSKFKLVDGKNEGKRKKVVSFALPDKSKTAIKTKAALNHSGQKPLKKKRGNAASEGMGELVIREKEDCLDPNENNEDLQIVMKSQDFDVNVTPATHSDFTGDENDTNVTRKKVRKTLRLFQVVSRKLLQEVESKLNERANSKRIDLHAARILRRKGNMLTQASKYWALSPGLKLVMNFNIGWSLI